MPARKSAPPTRVSNTPASTTPTPETADSGGTAESKRKPRKPTKDKARFQHSSFSLSVKWDDAADNRILMAWAKRDLRPSHYKNIVAAWPGEPKPTIKAVEERVVVLRKRLSAYCRDADLPETNSPIPDIPSEDDDDGMETSETPTAPPPSTSNPFGLNLRKRPNADVLEETDANKRARWMPDPSLTSFTFNRDPPTMPARQQTSTQRTISAEEIEKVDAVVAEVAAIKEKMAESEREAHDARVAEMLGRESGDGGEEAVPGDTEEDGAPVEGDGGYAMGGGQEMRGEDQDAAETLLDLSRNPVEHPK